MVAAVVAGDADGIAEAYDRYAASLYAYGHWLLPGPAATEVVLDTFLIAVSRLDGLRDPDRLDAWLHAVARNECLRGWARDCPEARKDPLGRPRRFPAQRIGTNLRPSLFRPNSAGGCCEPAPTTPRPGGRNGSA